MKTPRSKWWLAPLAILFLALSLVLNLRLPRVVAALLLGASLAAAGMVFQMLFRNPLVDSGFLGVSQGAAFGAALAILGAEDGMAWIESNPHLAGLLMVENGHALYSRKMQEYL